MASRILPRHSIGVQLPLVAGALVLVVAAAVAFAAYVTVRRDTIGVATGRLNAVTRQLADLSVSSTAGLRRQVRATAADPALAEFLADPAGVRSGRALAALEIASRDRSQVVAMELRDAAGVRRLATGPVADRIAATPGFDAFPHPADPDSGVTGTFRQLGDSLLYPVAARVPGQPAGYLVQWRLMLTTPAARTQLGQLIGADARFSLGNAEGGGWTDFSGIVPAPPVEPRRLQGVLRFTRPGEGDVLAEATPVAGTPWLLVVEFPARAIYAPVDAFFRTMALIGVVSVAIGLLAAWLLSRQLTVPLAQLTDVADAIAAGDTFRRVNLKRPDELGALAASLDAMALTVEASRVELERKVKARTRELHQALEKLQDTQESLVRREKLALLGHLASGVGHELRNPLGVMSNAVFYLELVLADAPDNVREYLEILRQQIALSGKIVNDLLDFSRVNPAQRQPIEIRSLAAAQLARLAPFTRITVCEEFPETLPRAHVDPVHAAQVVMNLLTNAVQAMGENGGSLCVRGRHTGDATVILEVVDTGPGVAPENLERIFEPLFTTKPRGIGLGLAVSKSLAKANGGDLAVRSEPGRGATFVFAMPVAPEAA